VHFVNKAWSEPPPLRDGDRSRVPDGFEVFLIVRTEPGTTTWDFLPLAGIAAGSAATNPQRPPKDPPSGPLPPPPARPVQPNPPRR
jgi:hypothetical protein